MRKKFYPSRDCAFIHTYGVAQCCSLLAVRRDLNAELAYVCGLLHDVYSYKTGYHVYHSINGAEMIRVTFKHELKDIFSEDEQTIIKSAIIHHSDKKHIHDSYDELSKDSDVLQHWLIDMSNNNKINIRLQGIKKEFGLPQSKIVVSEKEKIHNYFSRTRMGDIAENPAAKHIKGIETDADYMKIIRYYPEAFTRAFKQLWQSNPLVFRKEARFTQLYPRQLLPIKNDDDYMNGRKHVDITELYDLFVDRQECYFVCCDIKSLNPINQISYKAGDLAILEVLKRMDKVAGADDVVFRIGGDELFTSLHNTIKDCK